MGDEHAFLHEIENCTIIEDGKAYFVYSTQTT